MQCRQPRGVLQPVLMRLTSADYGGVRVGGALTASPPSRRRGCQSTGDHRAGWEHVAGRRLRPERSVQAVGGVAPMPGSAHSTTVCGHVLPACKPWEAIPGRFPQVSECSKQ